MFLIIDLEATCWENERKESEIIEIGAVLVNNDFQSISDFQTFVHPIIHPTLSPFCKKLTTISQKDVDDAPTFPTALSNLEKWAELQSGYPIHKIEFRSWGFYDKKQFQHDCNQHGVKYPFGYHRSVKHDFMNKRGMKSCGMTQGLSILGLRQVGTHHRGIDDARNIAQIFIEENKK